MAKAFTTWTVLPHDPIRELSENLWTCEGAIPRMALRRVGYPISGVSWSCTEG